ncbi:hypothetical protein LTR99_009135 [Exophiala xenobiotica]|uniref:Zn(2)-C6 fungal-type domain-containing protein n=1 Tax=Vermiconidia calcicola TaxID=1690605 RepID=A0AAV9Q012_9PEZI|nr:hypothetical protein LTR92_000880 [Exophiala xenobiotica]KAK5532401.1 hypothetical protein LTR25_007934 [Vermiconidia calcicola]KAK5541939.1 hypothetical protein LTR23_005541 [Chaetothyriales sp. CCFEE 6169]KAK5264929.1 hypothetical protein LTR96_009728 [Exophiala xenobiotica]KAK5295546.1 hypothetical protein LTR99_009135 [Exophiala xenobiotica]
MAIVVGEIQNPMRLTSLVTFDKRQQLWTPCECDRKPLPSGCRQCRNASRSCPGYRNELDLVFRDENDRIQQKCQAPSSSERTWVTKPGTTLDSSTKAVSAVAVTRSNPKNSPSALLASSKPPRSSLPPEDVGLLVPQLIQPLFDFATSFFFTQYVPGSHFDYLPVLYGNATPDSLLSTVVKAVSLASFSTEARSTSCLALARYQYTLGLKETNAALQASEPWANDELLASIMLLAYFEALSGQGWSESLDKTPTKTISTPSISAAWTRHVEGAYALLTMRPDCSNQSRVSARLGYHVSNTVRAGCVQQHIRIKPNISSPNPVARSVLGEEQDRHFLLLIETYAQLRAAVREGSLNNPTEIIRRARLIDSWATSMTKDLAVSASRFDIVTTTREVAGVYRNRYHLYTDHRVAQRWNTIRMTRLSLNEIMYEHAQRHPELFGECGRFARIVEQMATDICQSSSQFLTASGSLPGCSQTRLSIASSYVLIWPLFNSAATGLSPESINTFVIDRLHYLHREMNIPLAKTAARMLEEGDGNEDWMHMMHLF